MGVKFRAVVSKTKKIVRTSHNIKSTAAISGTLFFCHLFLVFISFLIKSVDNHISSIFSQGFIFLPPTNFSFSIFSFFFIVFPRCWCGDMLVISLYTILLFGQVQERNHTALESYTDYLLLGQGVETCPHSLLA